MKFTKEMVDDYANKLLFKLSDEENKMVLSEFNIINENMEFIANIPNINKVEAMDYCLDDMPFTLKKDIADTSPSINELLQNCDKKEGREVEVPRVVGNE